MRRAEREITDAAALAGILGRADYAVLAFLDGGMPALVPVSFGFRQEGGHFVFYFHSAVEGHKIDCLREDSRVSLCAVGDNRIELGTPVCRSTCRYESVIATGRIEFVTAPEAKRRALDCLMNILGTHDTPRILTVLGGKTCANKDEMAVTSMNADEVSAAKKKLKMAAVLQFTLPGVPCIYYGDENCMQGYLDPFCRGCYDWVNTDEELRAFYRKLGAIRSTYDVFAEGIFDEIFSDSGCIVYVRRTGNDSVYVYVNNSSTVYNIHFEGAFEELLTQREFSDKLTCEAFSYGIFRRKNK